MQLSHLNFEGNNYACPQESASRRRTVDDCIFYLMDVSDSSHAVGNQIWIATVIKVSAKEASNETNLIQTVGYICKA
jgi:hypothetical protein